MLSFNGLSRQQAQALAGSLLDVPKLDIIHANAALSLCAIQLLLTLSALATMDNRKPTTSW